MLTKEKQIEIINHSLKDMVDPRPYSQVTINDGFVQILTESDRSFFRNAIYWSVLNNNDAEEIVKKTIEMYTSKKLPFRWVVGPGTKPKNLREILLRNGMQEIPNGVPGAGMVTTYDEIKIPAQISNDDSYNFQPVENNEDVLNFVNVMQTCFPFAQNNTEFLTKAINDDVAASPRRIWYYLAKQNNKAIGILAARTYNNEFAYFSAGAVLPEYRRKGVIKQLGFYVLNYLKENDITTITTQTLPNTSEAICNKYGVETVCQVDTLIYTQPT